MYLLMTDFQRNVREPLKRCEITDDGSVEIMPVLERLMPNLLKIKRLKRGADDKDNDLAVPPPTPVIDVAPTTPPA